MEVKIKISNTISSTNYHLIVTFVSTITETGELTPIAYAN